MATFIALYLPLYMVIFILTAMVLPTLRLYKRTGIYAVTFGKNAETAHDYTGIIFKLIFIVVAVYGILNSFIVFDTIDYLNAFVIKVIGVLLSILSIVLILLAQKTMSDSWRIGIDEKNKTKLVKNGAFRYVRNPIFLGMLLFLISLFLMIPTYFMGNIVVLSYIIINIQVRLEEEFLERINGKEYVEYKRKVGRFLPKILK